MSLASDIQQIIDNSDVFVGIGVEHIESGASFGINADAVFPMCSVFKVPILVEALRQVSAGHISMEERIELTEDMKNLPSGILVFLDEGLSPTVKDLLTLMIIISDNTATDMIVDLLGGPAAVERTMHELGFTDTYFKMTIHELFRIGFGIKELKPTLTHYWEASKAGLLARDSPLYAETPENNVSTPADMTRLMAAIFRAEVLKRDACDTILEILLQQQLNDRLPRFLPRGTEVAHKTGTLPAVRNDSGIIYVNDHTHVAVTVFTRDDRLIPDEPQELIERFVAVDILIGQIGRAVYDAWST